MKLALTLKWWAAVGWAISWAVAEPTEDACDACCAHVADLQNTWENETTVAQILDTLQAECAADFQHNPAKRSLCDELAAVAVQLPPGLFHGMETLAWPIPLATCATLHQCLVPCCEPDAAPEQVHLSLPGRDTTRMGVSWVTLNSRDGSQVRYWADGKSPDESESAAAWNTTYTQAGWVGTIHRAVMTNLVPGTTYHYQVGAGASFSEVLSFTTFPDPAEGTGSVTFAVLGDMGYGSASDDTVANLIDLVEDGTIQAVIHSGDISYADGFMPHWDVFLNKVQRIASRVPYMVTPGNHEIWYNFSAYKHRFFMPGEMGDATDGCTGNTNCGSGDGMFYSWEIPFAGVHFLAADSETAWDTAKFSDTELAWIDRDLDLIDREATPWVVAHWHRPMWCSNNHKDCFEGAPYLRARGGAEDLLQGRVDLVLNAHVHSYERTLPLYNGSSTQADYAPPRAAPVYVVQGASGNREGNQGFPAEDDLPEWSAAHSSSLGFGLLTVSPTALNFTFYAANATTGPVLTDAFAMLQ